MTDIYDDLIPYINSESMPWFVIPKLQALGFNGMQIKEYGGPGFTHLETGVMFYELCKKDASIGLVVANHNFIGNAVLDMCGNQEQKDRLLSQTINMEKYIGFALTEPLNGSDATGLQTTATKVPGGYLLNGHKRWPGNGTFADYLIVWARNTDDGDRIQAFIAKKESKGYKAT